MTRKEHRAIIKTVKRSEIILKIAGATTVRPESSLDITLLQGIARNDRMDFILQKAVELMNNRIGNISEIAFESGFNSPAYFSKCFCEAYGVLPSTYAKQQAAVI